MKSSAQLILALLTTAGFFSCVFFMLTRAFPESNKDLLNIMFGMLGGSWTTQIQWFFGSSSSSRTKDSTIAEMVKPPTQTP